MLNLKAGPVPAEGSWNFLIQYMPYSLAVRELMRIRALYDLGTLERPILDVGCGDGLFWQHLVQSIRTKEVTDLSGLLGIDISADELQLASVRLAPEGGQVLNRDISAPGQWPADSKFRFVMANCSLEHVTRIEPALKNIHSLLESGGRFALFVPSPQWTDALKVKQWANRVSPRLGGLVAGCFDGFFQHRHLYPMEVWTFLLNGIGFEVEAVKAVGSRTANRIFENYLPSAFLAFVWKAIFKIYPPWLRRRRGSRQRLVQEFLREVQDGQVIMADVNDREVAEFYFLCRKK